MTESGASTTVYSTLHKCVWVMSVYTAVDSIQS